MEPKKEGFRDGRYFTDVLEIDVTTFGNICKEIVDEYKEKGIYKIAITRNCVFPKLVDKLIERDM